MSSLKKPLPNGYKCNACGAVDEHAIYNCPLKVVRKKRESSEREHEDEDDSPEDQKSESLSVYVTGLPFSTTAADLLSLLREVHVSESVGLKQIRLVVFPDNPRKCKGEWWKES